MTKHTTKALNTLLIFAILCAFCITPAAAATATENCLFCDYIFRPNLLYW